MSQKVAQAREIAERILEQTGNAMMAGNFEEFAACFRTPLEVDTFDGRTTLQTRAELEETYWNVRKCYLSQGVTNLVRHCVAAEFENADTVKTTHESRLYDGSIQIKGPQVGFSIITRRDDGWKLSYVQYAVPDLPNLNTALLRATNDLPEAEK